MSYPSHGVSPPPRSSSSSPPPPPPPPSSSLRSFSSSSSSSSPPSRRQFVEVSGVESGVVHSVKENYAFILCADREGELFFHMSDVVDEGGGAVLRKGDEVSFVVCMDPSVPGKLFGKRVQRLPPGSVTFEEIEQEGVEGRVEVTLKNFNGGKNKRTGQGGKGGTTRTAAGGSGGGGGGGGGNGEGYGGRIRRSEGVNDSSSSSSSSSSQSVFEFAERDLIDPSLVLSVGDVVSFSIFVEKKSRRRGATSVRLLSLNPTGRLRGVVSSVKEGFGFIRPEEGASDRDRERERERRTKELFFHFSALMDPTFTPTVGDELEFIEVNEGGRLSASRITSLPKGTIPQDEVSSTRFTGRLEKDLDFDSTGDSSSSTSSQRVSLVRYSPSLSTSVVLPFFASDCRDARPILLHGDVVSFAVVTKARTGEQRATQVTLVTPSMERRESGVVTTVNPSGGFAFIRRAEQEGELFLHATNYRASDSTTNTPSSSTSSSSPFITEGTEVEFNVHVADNGRLCAVRAMALPPGSVRCESQWEGRYRGVVHKEAKKKGKNNKGATGGGEMGRNGQNGAERERTTTTEEARGELRVTHLIDRESGARQPLTGGEAFVSCSFVPSSSPLPLLVGDEVECSVLTIKSTGSHHARDVRVLVPRSNGRERGLIAQLGSGGRTGRISSSSRTALLPFDASHFLHSLDGQPPQVGDGVEFDVVDGVESSTSSSSSSSRRGGGGHHGEKERKVASRVQLLPPGSVVIDSIDRRVAYRGRVEDIPSNPKNPKATPGHITVIGVKHNNESTTAQPPPPLSSSSSQPPPSTATAPDDIAALTSSPVTLDGATIDPSSFSVQSMSSTSLISSSSTPVHSSDSALPPSADVSTSLSSLSLSSSSPPPAPVVHLPPGSVVLFTFKDIAGHSFLARGDLVEFFVSSSTAPPSTSSSLSSSTPLTSSPSPSSSSSTTPHAADVTLLPLTATVSTVAGESQLWGHLSLMSVSSTSPSTPSSSLPDEVVVYLSTDVQDGAVLHCGDVVQVSAMSFHAERKRRQAKQIRLIKAAPKRETQVSERKKFRLTHSQSSSAIGGGGGGEGVAGGGGSGGSGGSSSSPGGGGGGSVLTTMRFARGPDETRGFAPRKSGQLLGVQIGLQRINTNTTTTTTSSSSSPSSHEAALSTSTAVSLTEPGTAAPLNSTPSDTTT